MGGPGSCVCSWSISLDGTLHIFVLMGWGIKKEKHWMDVKKENQVKKFRTKVFWKIFCLTFIPFHEYCIINKLEKKITFEFPDLLSLLWSHLKLLLSLIFFWIWHFECLSGKAYNKYKSVPKQSSQIILIQKIRHNGQSIYMWFSYSKAPK